MNCLTTPTSSFENLSDYPFQANYIEVGNGMKMHYLDEGKKDNPVILLLHGEPSWSYLYRKMIPILVNGGFRAIAPDLIGFGKSDKPTQQSDYTYERHLNWTKEILTQLDLNDITLFCQDWGGLIGLRLVTQFPDRFSKIVAANTILPTGITPPSTAFMKWRAFSQRANPFPVGQILQNATVSDLSPEVIAAYDAPFPDETYKAGAKIFPELVPIYSSEPEAVNNKAAWEVLFKWHKPFLTLFSDSDPIMAGLEKIFQKMIPGAKGQPHQIIEGAGHFLQEDKGEEIAEIMVSWLNSLK